MAKEKTVYREAPEVKDIADPLIEQYHSHLLDCKVRLDFVFVSKTPTRNGKEVWGTCRKITNLNAHLAGEDAAFFVIVISEPVWDVLPHDKRVALVDHELCHAWAEFEQSDDDAADVTKLAVKSHDVEEFAAVIKRHGLWQEDIKAFVEAALKEKGSDKPKVVTSPEGKPFVGLPRDHSFELN